MTGETAAKTCEHVFASHCYRGMSVRLCRLCHEPDWDGLRATLDAGSTRAFPIFARFAYPGNGYDGDKALAAEHLTPGETYLIDHMDVGSSHTAIYLHDFPDVPFGFNSVMFAAAWDDGDEWPDAESGDDA